MARETVTSIQTPARAKKARVGSVPDGQKICRSLWRHDFPSDTLLPGATSLPAGMSVIRQRTGGYQIKDECRRCGTVRTYTTTSGALYEVDTHYAYEHPADWVVFGEDLPYDRPTPTDFKVALHSDRAKLIKKSAVAEIRSALWHRVSSAPTT